MDKSIQDKIQKRIKGNRIVGLMRFRDSFTTTGSKHSWMLCGHPVYYWKMKAALESKHLEKVIIWTDVGKAQEMAEKWSDKFVVIRGNLNEFKDPTYKYTDDLKTSKSRISRARIYYDFTIKEHVAPEVIERIGFNPTVSVLLSVTTPLETGENIDELVKKYFEDDDAEEAHLVYKISPFILVPNSRHPQYLLDANGWIAQRGRQNLPVVYSPTGTFIRSYRWLYSQLRVFVEIPEKYGREIHTKEELELAEFYMKKRLEKNKNV